MHPNVPCKSKPHNGVLGSCAAPLGTRAVGRRRGAAPVFEDLAAFERHTVGWRRWHNRQRYMTALTACHSKDFCP